MKKIFLTLILILVLLGCAAPAENTAGNAFKTGDTAQSPSKYGDERIDAMGEPTYDEFDAGGYKILPFPGLTYSGMRDGKQAFYASNADYTFAIYADPSITVSGKSFDEVKSEFANLYETTCSEISTSAWVTQTRVFECDYYAESINADYKFTVFYRDGEYVSTSVGVWGTELKEYEYIFDSFNAHAVSWK